jgi:hypothetical protein
MHDHGEEVINLGSGHFEAAAAWFPSENADHIPHCPKPISDASGYRG